MKNYPLRNGKTVIIREPRPEDAEAVVALMKKADKETRFLAREPGEFQVTPEEERELIASILRGEGRTWYLAEYEGEIVGQCSVGLVQRNARFRHRASVAFLILQQYCNLGIGGKMMQSCLDWCYKHGIEQVELDVVADNTHAFAMYQSFGFEVIGKMPHALRYADGTYADEYLMCKRFEARP